MADDVTTWHHGLVARWWANFNLDGPEIDFFGRLVEAGQPALDLGCGTGRLLVPWVAAGLDVDGVDAAPDMITACRDGRGGPAVNPRSSCRRCTPSTCPAATARSSCAVCSGSARRATTTGNRSSGRTTTCFPAGCWRWTTRSASTTPSDGGGGGRRRLTRRRHRPPNAGLRRTAVSTRCATASLSWTSRRGRRTASCRSGSGATVSWSPTRRTTLVANGYEPAEIVAAFGAVGFVDVEVVGGYHGGPPTGAERFLVYLARRR